MNRAKEGDKIRLLEKSWIPIKLWGWIGTVIHVTDVNVVVSFQDTNTLYHVAHGGYAVCRERK